MMLRGGNVKVSQGVQDQEGRKEVRQSQMEEVEGGKQQVLGNCRIFWNQKTKCILNPRGAPRTYFGSVLQFCKWHL
jgi:hypothetical protein